MEVLTAVDADRIAALRARDEFFWLDLLSPGDAELDRVAGLLDLHPAAVEDTREWDQIPKLDEYGEHFMLVMYSARLARGPEQVAEPVEVHVYLAGQFVLTVRRCETPLDRRHEVVRRGGGHAEEEALYQVLDALADGWDPVIDEIDRVVDQVEVEVLEHPRQSQLRTIYRLKQDVGELARRSAPQVELLRATADIVENHPAISRGSREWLRDVTTHMDSVAGDLARINADLRALTDTFFNANANRLNRIATLFAVGGTFFLIWTVVTGFFGQNFGWLVGNIDTRSDFLTFGVGSLVGTTVVAAGLLWWRRDDWWQ